MTTASASYTVIRTVPGLVIWGLCYRRLGDESRFRQYYKFFKGGYWMAITIFESRRVYKAYQCFGYGPVSIVGCDGPKYYGGWEGNLGHWLSRTSYFVGFKSLSRFQFYTALDRLY